MVSNLGTYYYLTRSLCQIVTQVQQLHDTLYKHKHGCGLFPGAELSQLDTPSNTSSSSYSTLRHRRRGSTIKSVEETRCSVSFDVRRRLSMGAVLLMKDRNCSILSYAPPVWTYKKHFSVAGELGLDDRGYHHRTVTAASSR